jgi:hypothetical protein
MKAKAAACSHHPLSSGSSEGPVFLSVCLSACSGNSYLDPITAAGIISNLKSSGTLAGFNSWSAAFDVDNSMWSSQVKAHLS